MKLVMIIDPRLPLGLIANAAAVMGLSFGNTVSGIIGPDLPDREGRIHAGITRISIPILSATGEYIRDLRNQLYRAEYTEVKTVDFSTVAQQSKCYSNYAQTLLQLGREELDYLSIGLYGPEKQINQLTGSLKLLR